MSIEILNLPYHLGPVTEEETLVVDLDLPYERNKDVKQRTAMLQRLSREAEQAGKRFFKVNFSNGSRLYQFTHDLNPKTEGKKYITRVPQYGVDDFRKDDE
jgi:hypothetical protein